MGKLVSPKAGLLAAVAALSLFVASMASGELVQEGNFRISFHGGIAPEKLPRNELAPVGVQIGAKIKTVDRTKPPRLAEITLASGSGYISAFDLSLKRRYSLRGEKRSYVSASCPLPAGVATASFPLVRSTYGFEDEAHTEVVSVLTRECRVRG